MAWLDDNPPERSQFRAPRRERPSGVMVIHTAENTPDFVAFDGGAEAVARFIRDRSDPGSYHDLVDSDSAIQLVDYGNEAYQDGTGSNPHAWSGSVATRADVWPLAPRAWRDGAIRQLAGRAAAYARWLRATTGIVVPARRITRAQSENRIPGFISHAERDPGRRSDPGAGFPWDQFFAEYTAALGGTTPQEDDMPLNDADVDKVLDEMQRRLATQGHELRHTFGDIVGGQVRLNRDKPMLAWTGEGPVYLLAEDRQTKRLVAGWDKVDLEVFFGAVHGGTFRHTDGRIHPRPFTLDQEYLDSIDTVEPEVA